MEQAGVFTLLMGDLGSYHTAMSVDTFRGYALADAVAPMIVVNDRDARGAWSFTLLHEFCHLMLGATGVSTGYGTQAIERLCNDVASGVLLDEDELAEVALPVEGGADALAAPIVRVRTGAEPEPDLGGLPATQVRARELQSVGGSVRLFPTAVARVSRS